MQETTQQEDFTAGAERILFSADRILVASVMEQFSFPPERAGGASIARDRWFAPLAVVRVRPGLPLGDPSPGASVSDRLEPGKFAWGNALNGFKIKN